MTALAYAYDPGESAASMPAMLRSTQKFAYHLARGRFLQTDPVGYEDSLNLYAYVGNDPLNLIDPTGRQGRPPDDSWRPGDERRQEIARQTQPEAGFTGKSDID